MHPNTSNQKPWKKLLSWEGEPVPLIKLPNLDPPHSHGDQMWTFLFFSKKPCNIRSHPTWVCFCVSKELEIVYLLWREMLTQHTRAVSIITEWNLFSYFISSHPWVCTLPGSIPAEHQVRKFKVLSGSGHFAAAFRCKNLCRSLTYSFSHYFTALWNWKHIVQHWHPHEFLFLWETASQKRKV